MSIFIVEVSSDKDAYLLYDIADTTIELSASDLELLKMFVQKRIYELDRYIHEPLPNCSLYSSKETEDKEWFEQRVILEALLKKLESL